MLLFCESGTYPTRLYTMYHLRKNANISKWSKGDSPFWNMRTFLRKKNRGFPFIILFMICKKKMFRVCFSLHYYVNFYRVHVHSNKTVRLIYNLRDNPVSSILVYIMFYKMFQKHKSHIHSQMHCLYCCKEVID